MYFASTRLQGIAMGNSEEELQVQALQLGYQEQ